MILRPLDPPPAGSEEFVDAWPVVERLQRQKYESCWMITQPSHAALAGEIAGKLTGPQIPQLDASLVRAIALHDAGWGACDAQAIVSSRSRSAEPPKSFLQTGIPEFLTAWTQSIEIAQKENEAGGYMVSRHFSRLAEHHLAHGDSAELDRKKLQRFLNAESARQKKLMTKAAKTSPELERLTDLLQFCDLVSLYICSGAQQRVRLPEYWGVTAKLVVHGSDYQLDPPLIAANSKFLVAALRYPPRKGETAREIQVEIK